MTKGDGMSFAEFTYPIMQGWDWYKLLCRERVHMQIGGSDQYGNIISGIEVVKAARANNTDPAYQLPTGPLDDPVGFTVPLLTDSSGAKFGKSAGNAIWLDQYLTSSFDLYGYFVRRPDADVEQLLKLFTFLPLQEIQEVMVKHNADPSKRVAQHLLASEVVSLIHGETAAKEAQEQHGQMFSKNSTILEAAPGRTPEMEPYDPVEEQTTLNNAPRIDMILPKSLILGQSIGRILQAARLVKSSSEGHRLAASQGAYIGGMPGQKKPMETAAISFTPIKLWFPQETQKFLINGELLILRKGKHNVRVIRVVSDEEYEVSGETYPGQPGTGATRKLNRHLKELKAGLRTAQETEEALAADEQENSDEPEPILVFPKDKGRQQLDVESKLKSELSKSKEGPSKSNS